MSVAGTQPVQSPAPRQAGAGDERLATVSPIVRLLQRPELGALIGAVAVIPMGLLVDRVRRIPMLSVSIVLWSVTTLLGAFALLHQEDG